MTAVVAAVSVEWAINPRFMSDVAAFINESNQATQLYLESQCQALLRDVELTAGDIARSPLSLSSDRLSSRNISARDPRRWGSTPLR